MPAPINTVQERLKIRIITSRIRDESEVKPSENVMKLGGSNGLKNRVTGDGNKNSQANVLGKAYTPANHKKRSPDTSLDGQSEKRRRMDHSVKQQCASILKGLMNHSFGKIFSEPIDPVKMNIPNYFSIIAKPMDLGTIKHKLDGNRYFDVEEFVADVRLTFSNAMLCNHCGLWARSWAKQLDAIFNMRWKLLEAKLKSESKNADQASVFKAVDASTQTLKKNPPMPSLEKQKLCLKIVELFSKNMTGNLLGVIQKFGLTGLKEESVSSFINAADDDTLWKLRTALKNFLDAKAIKVEPAKYTKSGRSVLGKSVQKGTEILSQRALTSSYHKQSTVSNATKCSSCGGLTCHCRLKVPSAQTSSSDITSEKSSGPDVCGDSKVGCEARYSLASHTSRLGPDCNGCTSFNIQLSPKKALRAAMLKSRYADTIFRATHQKLQDHGEKYNLVKWKQERERLERELFEAKARFDAENKAAQALSQKISCETKREAARMAIRKMRKTVEIYENLDIIKDLEKMFYCGSLSERGVMSSGSPLEQLGLYIKDEYSLSFEDEDEILDREEGEILS